MRNYVIAAVVIVALVAAGFWFAHKKVTQAPKPQACTAEAKICPDGTSVGRTGPNCEFAPCPTVEGASTSTPSGKG